MTALRVTTIDEQPAVVLTPELAARLNIQAGGELHAVDSHCGIELVASPEVATQLEIARRVMREDAATLSRLAE